MQKKDGYPFKYFLVAADKNGNPFVWGFFPKLAQAKRAQLPNTWVIDEDGKVLARASA